MSCGPLPPLPDLIPISALRKSPPGGGSGEKERGRRDCAPCATRREVMGEQRSRRTGNQPTVDLIDNARSRGPSAAPQPPQSRKARSSRHRKSDRRRDHRRPDRTRSRSKHNPSSREDQILSSPERPANPRVNPIFVWVRQEDTRIVDVKCEDYDKRNRILLTKTAQGWRAIPRTETLVPSLKEAAERDHDRDERDQHHHHHHHHHRNRKSRKNKVKRKSAAVQVDSDIQEIDEESQAASPSWSSPVNIESHLPSHKIHVPRKKSPIPGRSATPDIPSVNSVVGDSAHAQIVKCSAGKICDVTPLDNLLAVAELEFNQQIQSGEWDKHPTEPKDMEKDIKDFDEEQKSFIENMEHLNSLLESCTKANEDSKIIADDFSDHHDKSEECDYTEDDDNNLAMDDILSRLEQSLRSPESTEISENLNECDTNFETKMDDLKDIECLASDINENNYKIVPEYENFFEEDKKDTESQEEQPFEDDTAKEETQDEEILDMPDEGETAIPDCSLLEDSEHNQENDNAVHETTAEEFTEERTLDEKKEDNLVDCQEDDDLVDCQEYDNLVDSREENITDIPIETFLETTDNLVENISENTDNNETNIEEITDEPSDDQPTDLSFKTKSKDVDFETSSNYNSSNEVDEPTDLSVPKPLNSPTRSVTPRPPSQNSEAIQSPQPSGIPAVPPSPDIVSPTAVSNSKSKSVFLESLLSATSQKLPQSTEVTLVRQKEPLDLGKCRKSASPTVSCSEEVKNNNKDMSPDSEPPSKKFKSGDISLKTLLDVEAANVIKSLEKVSQETPRLIELLKSDTELDPVSQLRQLLKDTSLNLPDPMLVPKDRLSCIISNPGKEIPRLLKQRPELRLPEALAYPNLLQDPDILVITLQQLETIIQKQNQTLPLRDLKHHAEKVQEKMTAKRNERLSEQTRENVPAKRKNVGEAIPKTSIPQEPQNKNVNSMNELASDIDAATTAAFNQMMWLPYLNQLDAMSFGNNPDAMKMLNGSMPFYPGQMPDLSHLFGASRFPPPIGFPMQPQINYNNPLEMSMWQEAMMQANMLRPKTHFESLSPKNSFRDYLDKLNFTTSSKKASSSSNNQSQKSHVANSNNISKQNLGTNFYHNPPGSSSGSGHSYQNSFLGNNPNAYQSSNSKQNLQIPNFNHFYPQKTPASNHHSQQKVNSHNFYHKSQQQRYENMCSFPGYPQQKMDDKISSLYNQRHQQEMGSQKPKLQCKSFASMPQHKSGAHVEQQHTKEKPPTNDLSKQQTTQPIDLSGSTTSGGKIKGKQRHTDPVNASKLLKHDDIPEVGSTTASIEEMQDAHKHLWHPLFGNQKGYTSPWNWTSVKATGE